jgi:uncharacterized protein involved in exopolysaccharide biosynthesis
MSRDTSEPSTLPARPTASSGREVELADVLLAGWSARWQVLALTAVFAILSVGGARLLTKDFESSLLLSVENPEKDYATLATSRTVVRKAYDTLSGQGVSLPPFDAFWQGAVTATPTDSGRLLELAVRLPDAAAAQRAATVLGEELLHISRAVISSAAIQKRDSLRIQTAQALNQLQSKEQRLLDFKIRMEPEALARDVSALLGLRERRQDVMIRLEKERARLTAARRELAARKSVVSLERAVLEAPLMAELVRRGTEASGVPLGTRFMQDELDPVFSRVDGLVAEGSAEVASLEREQGELDQRLGASHGKSGALQRHYSTVSELERLEFDLRNTRTTVEELTKRLASAEAEAGAVSSDISIVAPAVVSDEPIGAPLPLVLVAGALAGFLVGTVSVFLSNYLKAYSQP